MVYFNILKQKNQHLCYFIFFPGLRFCQQLFFNVPNLGSLNKPGL